MSIDDEIRRKKQSMQAAVDAEAKRKADAKRMRIALDAAGMNINPPIVRMPPQDLQAVITETLPRMTFNTPKIVRSMPDGTIRARDAHDFRNKSARADDYSFDVLVKEETIDKSTTRTSIWVFKNGSVAFVKNNDLNINNLGVPASTVREKIIEAIANSQVVRPQSSMNQSQTSGGCYIATAVYGSYDCPEVWMLRRYRDCTLRSTWYGRLFIKTYYALSPSLVKWFGETKWFKCFWRKRLDSLTNNLKRKGFSNKPYDD